MEHVAAVGRFGKTDNLNGGGGTRGFELASLFVGHGADAADSRTRDDNVAALERTVLNKNCCNGTAALVKLGFDNGALCLTVGVCFELFYFGGEDNHFQKVVNTDVLLCGNIDARNVAAPFFGNKSLLGKLLLNSVGVRTLFIYLIYRNDDADIGSLGVVYCLNCLRHDAVVRRNNDNRNVGNLCAAHTHSGECLVTGSVKEGD